MTDNDEIIMFRPEENAKRAANGCVRLSMPEISKDVFLDGVKEKFGARKITTRNLDKYLRM